MPVFVRKLYLFSYGVELQGNLAQCLSPLQGIFASYYKLPTTGSLKDGKHIPLRSGIAKQLIDPQGFYVLLGYRLLSQVIKYQSLAQEDKNDLSSPCLTVFTSAPGRRKFQKPFKYHIGKMRVAQIRKIEILNC